MLSFFRFNRKKDSSGDTNSSMIKPEDTNTESPAQQTITKVFTDREGPRQSFWNAYEDFRYTLSTNDRNIRVLMYYGIGGIGKTSLLRKLMAEMDERIAHPFYAYIDLNIQREQRPVLESLRNLLSRNYGFEFPFYDLASYAYAKKLGRN